MDLAAPPRSCSICARRTCTGRRPAVPPARPITVENPATERDHRAGAGRHGRPTSTARSPPPGPPSPAGPATADGRARPPHLDRLHTALAARAGDIARTVGLELGTPLKIAKAVQAGLPLTVLRGYADLAARPPAERDDRQLAGRPRAGRRGRRDHPVELPAAPGGGEGRGRAGGRLHGGAQAERADPAGGVPALRRGRRGRRAGRRAQPGHRHRAGGRRGHRRAPGRRHGLVHRLDRDRPARSRTRPPTGSPGSRWSWAASRPT